MFATKAALRQRQRDIMHDESLLDPVLKELLDAGEIDVAWGYWAKCAKHLDTYNVDEHEIEVEVPACQELLDALKSVMEWNGKGIPKLPLKLKQRIDQIINNNERKPKTPRPCFQPLPQFSRRKNEVLKWMVEGKRNSEIAAILHLSPRTVEKHVADILKELKVENRTTAIIRAMEITAFAAAGELQQ